MAPAKALIDTVIWRAGDAVGALVMLAGVSLLGLSATRLSVASLLLLAAWIVAAVAAERHYVRNLRNSIYEHRLDVERLAQVAERSATDALTDALGSGDPSDILYALTLLEGREGDSASAGSPPARSLACLTCAEKPWHCSQMLTTTPFWTASSVCFTTMPIKAFAPRPSCICRASATWIRWSGSQSSITPCELGGLRHRAVPRSSRAEAEYRSGAALVGCGAQP